MKYGLPETLVSTTLEQANSNVEEAVREIEKFKSCLEESQFKSCLEESQEI